MNPAKLLLRTETIDAGFGNARVDLLHETGHANLEKFVEIGADDREKFDAFQQGMSVALRLLQHAAIESQPR